MLILGLETSSSICGIGIARDGELLAEMKINIPNAHSEKLFQGIDVLLKAVPIKAKDLSGVAVSSGPGSFTGLRIGLSTAKGISYALEIPLFLVPTLDVFAGSGEGFEKTVCSIIPSIRGDVFYSFYREESGKMKRVSDFKLGKIEEMEVNGFDELLFTGIIDDSIRSRIGKKFGNSKVYFVDSRKLAVGYFVARMGYEKMLEGYSDNLEDSEPLYLRDFDIKKKNL
mgnify:CR=1 FL=1